MIRTAEIAVIVNICVVTVIAALSAALARSMSRTPHEDRRFLFLAALGWGFNAAYLVAEELVGPGQLGTSIVQLATILSASTVSSIFFLLAATLHGPQSKSIPGPFLSVVVCLVLVVFTLGVGLGLSANDAARPLVRGVMLLPNVAFGSFALWHLAGSYQLTLGSPADIGAWPARAVVWSLRAYAVLQWAYCFQVAGDQVLAESINTAAFVLGPICKIVHGAGLLLFAVEHIVAGETVRRNKRFVAEMAHELINPTAELQIHSGLLLQPQLQSRDQKRIAKDIQDVALRINAIVIGTHELLKDPMVSEDAPTRSSVLEPCNANVCAQMAVMAVKNAREERATVVMEHVQQPFVLAARNDLVRVLVNLLNNAYDATRSRGEVARITVRTSRFPESGPGETSPGMRIIIEVIDNGEGIAPEHAASVFSRGFSTRAGDGRGLGLFISKQLVDRWGGSLAVASEGPGTGASARIELPYTLQRPENWRGVRRGIK